MVLCRVFRHEADIGEDNFREVRLAVQHAEAFECHLAGLEIRALEVEFAIICDAFGIGGLFSGDERDVLEDSLGALDLTAGKADAALAGLIERKRTQHGRRRSWVSFAEFDPRQLAVGKFDSGRAGAILVLVFVAACRKQSYGGNACQQIFHL